MGRFRTIIERTLCNNKELWQCGQKSQAKPYRIIAIYRSVEQTGKNIQFSAEFRGLSHTSYRQTYPIFAKRGRRPSEARRVVRL
jgi:hypothetical protein